MIRFLLLHFICSMLGFNSLAGEKTVPPMNVLFIGNSYTHMNKMPKIFEKIAQSRGVKINVEMSAKSNHTFRMHTHRPEMFDKINSKKWDYVVLQGFSRELAQEEGYIDTASVPFISQILDSIYTNNSCTKVLLYMTWGYKNGYEYQEELATNVAMGQAVRHGYEYVSELYGLPMVPVGPVFSTYRAQKNPTELYNPDEQHPSYEGSYLIACTFYSAIFKHPPITNYRGKASKRRVKSLQKTAYDYVMSHLDTFKLNENTLNVTYERTRKGEYFVHCTANYPNAVSLSWDFGDGNASNDDNVTHRYTKDGSYWVTLRVNDACGVRVVKRKVSFKAPKKPTQNTPKEPVMDAAEPKRI